MKQKLNRLILGATALAVAAGGLVLAGSSAQAALEGGVTIGGGGGALNVRSVLPNPSPAYCPGTSSDGYLWSSFISDAGNDPANFTYPGGVPTPGGTAVGVTYQLVDDLGNSVGGNTASATPTDPRGQIDPIPLIDLGAYTAAGIPLADGEYNVGFACFLGGATVSHWSSPITVTGNNFTQGISAPTPVLANGGTVSGDPTTRRINITNPTTDATSYSLAVTPAPSGALPTVNPGASSFDLTGLTLGTNYSVVLTANKTGFPSKPSAALSFTAAATGPQPVVDAPNVLAGTAPVVTWTIPTVAGVPAPSGYLVAVSGGPTTVADQTVGTTSATLPNDLLAGAYTVTVTPQYSGGGVTATAGSDTFNVSPGAAILQEISVARPEGALIISQRCGVNNPLPAVSIDVDNPAFSDDVLLGDGFPGFPFNLDPESQSGGAIGNAPTIVDIDGTPVDGPDAGTTVGPDLDPDFSNYPQGNDDRSNAFDIPDGNITECGLEMGVAELVDEFNSDGTDDLLEGEFFAASGRLDEVTVLDTTDDDNGWDLVIDVEDEFSLLSGSGDTFSGNYLGMIPKLTDDSDVVGGEGYAGSTTLYDQLVKTGPQAGSQRANGLVLPGDGFPAGLDATPNAIGMTDEPVLASAPADAGLGIATIDARMLLLIPVSIDAGAYSAHLTLTAS